MDVELLHWPVDEERLVELRSAGRARLLVIDPGTEAPVSDDLLEDWIRRPASIHDLRARIAGLERRIELSSPDQPVIDDCVVRFRGRLVPVPPVETRIVTLLIERVGVVVSRERLSRAGWPHGVSDRNALDVHMMRLRRRVGEIGLVIRTVRGRGYLLESRD